MTYISLFDCAEIGCYDFKQEEFHCIATNELMERYLAVPKVNNKCELDTSYICGGITLSNAEQKIYTEINKCNKKGNDGVAVVIATLPCKE